MKTIKDQYDCPNCKSRLNLQWEFDPWKIYWKCEECGTWLHHAHVLDLYEIYDGPSPYGEESLETDDFDAGDAKADNFNTPSSDGGGELGTEIKEAPEPEASSEIEVSDEWEDILTKETEKKEPAEEKKDPTRKKGFTWPLKKKEKEELPVEEEQIENQIEEKKSFWQKLNDFISHMRRHWKKYLIGIAILAVVITGTIIYRQYNKLIVIGVSSDEAVTMKYDDLAESLKTAGFESIEAIPLEDLSSKNMAKEGSVDLISVNGETTFDADKKFPCDCVIQIQYHSAKNIKMPLDPKTVKEKSVQELQNLLEKAGFENVQTVADYDLILGILHKEGEVEKITVDGSEKFDEQKDYRIDTEIVIVYHDFKRNKKEK